MYDAELAAERANADRLPVLRRIGQHRRPPYRLDGARPVSLRNRQDTEIRDHDSGLWPIGQERHNLFVSSDW